MQTKRVVLLLFFSCCLVLCWICADDIEVRSNQGCIGWFSRGFSKSAQKLKMYRRDWATQANLTSPNMAHCLAHVTCTCDNTRHRPVRWKADESREKAGWRSCRKTLLYSRLMSCPVWIIDFRNKDRSLHGRLQPGMWSGLRPDPQ